MNNNKKLINELNKVTKQINELSSIVKFNQLKNYELHELFFQANSLNKQIKGLK